MIEAQEILEKTIGDFNRALKSDYPQMPEQQRAHICLTLLPPLLATALTLVRAELIERAAQICEKVGSELSFPEDEEALSAEECCAKRIRAIAP